MGRRKKKPDNNNTVGIIVLVVILLVYLKTAFFNDFNPVKDIDWSKFKLPQKEQNIEVTERTVVEDYSNLPPEKETQQVQESVVEVFFTKTGSNGKVFTAVQRKKASNISDIEYAVKMLLSGPTKSDKKLGLYSEIPTSTKLLYVKESPSRVVVNLSSDFEYGGGGDSLYTRMYQLIKTVNKNTTKPVYLYIDGKQATMIGGEGLMLKQPLRSNSLDD